MGGSHRTRWFGQIRETAEEIRVRLEAIESIQEGQGFGVELPAHAEDGHVDVELDVDVVALKVGGRDLCRVGEENGVDCVADFARKAENGSML